MDRTSCGRHGGGNGSIHISFFLAHRDLFPSVVDAEHQERTRLMAED